MSLAVPIRPLLEGRAAFLFLALGAGAMLWSLSGCGGDSGGGSGRRRGGRGSRSKASKASAVADLTEETEEDEESVYEHKESVNARDPFRAYLRDFVKKAGEEGELKVPKSQLEMFEINELRPIAIITGTPVPKAMVTDPSGMGHVIQPGTRIGRTGGKVIRISKNAIVIRHVEDEYGTARETLVKLHEVDESEEYRLNIVRHDTESQKRAQEEQEEGVLEGLDIDTLLRAKRPRAPRSNSPAAARDEL